MQNVSINNSLLLKYLNILLIKKIEEFNSKIFSCINKSSPFYISSEEALNLIEQIDIDNVIPELNHQKENREEDEFFIDCLKKDTLFPGLYHLAEIFNLNLIELKLLLFLTAFEIDKRYKKIFCYLADNLLIKYPTVEVLLYLLFDNDFLRKGNIFPVLENKIVKTYSLIEIIDVENVSNFLEQQLKIRKSVISFILQQTRFDDDIAGFCSISYYENKCITDTTVAKLLKRITKHMEEYKSVIVSLQGRKGSGKKEYALNVADSLKLNLISIDTTFLMQDLTKINERIKSIFINALLQHSILYFKNFDLFFKNENYPLYENYLLKVIADYKSIVITGSHEKWTPEYLDEDCVYIRHSFINPDYKESFELWREAFNECNITVPDKVLFNLVNMFMFSKGEINRIVSILSGKINGENSFDEKELFRLCRENVHSKLRNYAQLIRSKYELNDIILPDEQLSQINDFINYWKNRRKVLDEWGFNKRVEGTGVIALFNGPPGTGKTMAAGIVAKSLNLAMYRIDLSQLVSKYIGETEKNLSGVFDSAEGMGVLLFFDEADSVFGKRTEVGDSHDKYANLETSYLLQRIEEYNGPVVLASNFLRNIDEAFMRRIHFIIEFSQPNKEISRRIWEVVFPDNVQLSDDLNINFLVEKFKFSGGNIRNIAVNSAFYAVEENLDEIKMKHIIMATKGELKKIGKICNQTDFGKYWIEN